MHSFVEIIYCPIVQIEIYKIVGMGVSIFAFIYLCIEFVFVHFHGVLIACPF